MFPSRWIWTVSPRASHRAGGGFDSSTTRSPSWPSVIGAFVLLDAVDEVLGFDAQRFAVVELRRPHVAGAVADPHLVDLLRVVGEADALVVDLDLLAGLEVVVDDHLLAAADQHLPHLDRRQPVDVDVGDGARLS